MIAPMTMLVSIFGVAGRFAGDLLTTALGWASSLLFGRVPQKHHMYVIGMMALSFLWLLFLIALLVPAAANLLVTTTPHPRSINSWIGVALLVGVVAFPALVGLLGHLVPADGQRGGVAEPRRRHRPRVRPGAADRRPAGLPRRRGPRPQGPQPDARLVGRPRRGRHRAGRLRRGRRRPRRGPP